MSSRGQYIIIAFSFLFLFYVLNELRRQKINEEFCLWWIVIMVVMDILLLNQKLLLQITHLIGALMPVSTLTMFSLLLLFATLIYFSMKVSVLTRQLKELAQSFALQKQEMESLFNELKMGKAAR